MARGFEVQDEQNMKHDIIKTDNYLFIGSDEEIKAGDFYLLIPENIVRLSRSGLPTNITEWAKIIAHLPLNGAECLEGVDLLPPLEDEVEKLADELWKKPNYRNNNPPYLYNLGVKDGYNKAKEKYKYTEEDIRKAITMACEQYLVKYTDNDYDFEEDEIIQSLQQPKYPIGFEMVMVDFEVDMGLGEECIQYGQYPKTTTNLEDQKVLVGKYIYE